MCKNGTIDFLDHVTYTLLYVDKNMSELHKRTLVKTISWRVVATTTTMGLVYLFTGELSLSLGVGVLEVVSKMLLYYVHERMWNRVDWGEKPYDNI